MKYKECEMVAKVVNTWPIEEFWGEAMRASPDPRYVVALANLDSKKTTEVDGHVALTGYEIYFFAVGSLSRVFLSTEIDGECFRMRIQERSVDDSKIFFLQSKEKLDEI